MAETSGVCWTIIIVEGYTDALLYGKFIHEDVCAIEIACNKETALEVNNILKQMGVKGIIVIIDSDFSKIEGTVFENDNVFSTDYHDLETMLIASRALAEVLRQHGSRSKIDKLKVPVLNALLNAAFPIGMLRWISSESQRNLGLKFEGLRFKSFTDKSTLNIDIRRLVVVVISRTDSCGLNARDLEDELRNLLDRDFDRLQSCVGHDLVELLLIGLRKKFGTAKKLNLEVLDKALRIAYDPNCFSSTLLYSSLRMWEQQNSGYTIFSS